MVHPKLAFSCHQLLRNRSCQPLSAIRVKAGIFRCWAPVFIVRQCLFAAVCFRYIMLMSILLTPYPFHFTLHYDASYLPVPVPFDENLITSFYKLMQLLYHWYISYTTGSAKTYLVTTTLNPQILPNPCRCSCKKESITGYVSRLHLSTTWLIWLTCCP